MTVYVDDMEAPYGRMIMCHMIADSTEELNAMADKIGVQRKWIQKAGTYQEHYDIAKVKRTMAVGRGAIQINRTELGSMLRHRRLLGSLNTPEEAVKWLYRSMDQTKEEK